MANRTLRSQSGIKKKPVYVVSSSGSEDDSETSVKSVGKGSDLSATDDDSEPKPSLPRRRQNPPRSSRRVLTVHSDSSIEEEDEEESEESSEGEVKTKIKKKAPVIKDSSEEDIFCAVCKREDELKECHHCQIDICTSCDTLLKTVSEYTTCSETDTSRFDWLCYNCDSFGGEIDTILTYKTENKRKLYLVKWETMSYHDVSWTLASWLKHSSASKLRNFEVRVANLPNPPEKSEVINSEWLVPELILDVTSSGTKLPSKVQQVEEVLVKWTGLPFDKSTWEFYHKVPTGLQDKLLPLTEKLLKYFKIKQPSSSGPNSLEKNFIELKEQPSFIKGGTLFPYQLEGLNWLYYLWTLGRPSIIADEMGLGKTIQVACFLNLIFLKANVFPFLIIVPKAVISNWYREFDYWAPNLCVAIYTGSNFERSILKDTKVFQDGTLSAHILLTTYDTVIRDYTYINKFGPWEVVVLDEGQRLKSGISKTFKKLNNLTSKHRVLMTGTPLQNNINELFTLMSFMDPKVFNNPAEFEEKYSDLNEQTVSSLHKLLQPYFLRRTKALVLKDFPKKVEVTVPVSMTKLQKELCKATLSRNIKLLASIAPGKAINNQPTLRSNLTNIFMELRKCLNHPYLHLGVEPLDDNPPPDIIHQRLIDASGKLKILHRIFKILQTQGHRVLLFSQFKLVLDIIEDYLEFEKIKFLRIDGDLKGECRQTLIDQFNEPGSDIFIFLLTTRAGGVGMNLASADTVIIYDMDFNPHSDLQALSRAHRIGQKNDVLVLRLVTMDSIEERIMQIAKNKLVLDHLIIEKMGEVDISPVDIESIIRFGAKKLFDEEDLKKELNYSDQELLELLDRSALANTEEVDSQANSFGLARVWTTSEADSKNDDDAKNFWNSLLETRLADANKEEEKLGRGARRRTNRITHNQSHWSSDADNSVHSDYKLNSSSESEEEEDHQEDESHMLENLAGADESTGKKPRARAIKKPRVSSLHNSTHNSTHNSVHDSTHNSVHDSTLNSIHISVHNSVHNSGQNNSEAFKLYQEEMAKARKVSDFRNSLLLKRESNLSLPTGYVRPRPIVVPSPPQTNTHYHSVKFAPNLDPRSHAFRPNVGSPTNCTSPSGHLNSIHPSSPPPNNYRPINHTVPHVPNRPANIHPGHTSAHAILYFCTWCQVNHASQCPMYVYNYSVQQLKHGLAQNPQLVTEPRFNYFTQWCLAQQNLPLYSGPMPTLDRIKALFPCPRPSPDNPKPAYNLS